MKRKILVIGAANFIGSRTLAALQRSDWAAPTPGDADSLTDEFDGVANCTVGSANTVRAQAKALFERTLRSKLKPRVVHLSSMTVYGSASRVVDETTPPVLDLGDYGAAHVEAETLANAYPNSVVLRCGCEYGPECPQWTERIARLLRAHRLGDLGAAGDGVCNLLYIDDLVGAIVSSLHSPAAAGQSFNLAMRAPPTWNQYFIQFGILLRAVPVSRITARQLTIETRLLAPPLKILELAVQRVAPRYAARPAAITPSLAKLCQQQITLDVGKAERLLGIRWTDLGAGLRSAALSASGR